MNHLYPSEPAKKQNGNPYQRYTYYVLGIALLAVIISIIGFAVRRNAADKSLVPIEANQNYMPNYSAKAPASQENEVFESGAPEKPLEKQTYRVGISGGKIAVFKNDDTAPFMITKVYVEHLPEEDVRLLQNGIILSSFQEVKAFLEDFE